jgi:glucose-1-phosphate thymidylyltransferase
MTKAIILAGGSGTRLYPSTLAVSKQLLPIFDKPTIYYPLTTVMLAGIQDILIITTPHEEALFKQLLKDGSQWGLNIEYAIQEQPKGIADAFIIGEKFIGNDNVFLILGDNIIHGHNLANDLPDAAEKNQGATVFCFKVKDPERYGVVGFDESGRVNEIVEKPTTPPSRYAVSGLYFYDSDVVDIAKHLKPSPRGELEITDVNRVYLERNQLNVKTFSRGIAWLDTGTPESMLAASNFIHILEQRQGLRIGCPEEIAWRRKYISDAQLAELAKPLVKSGYGKYLLELLDENKND